MSRFAVPIFAAVAALASPAASVAQTPDVTGDPTIRAAPLGALINDAKNIVLLEVEVSADNTITFKKVADLKGKTGSEAIKHRLPEEVSGWYQERDRKSLLEWAKPGRRAIGFHLSGYQPSACVVCVGNYWYAAEEEQLDKKAPGKVSGNWNAGRAVDGWAMTYVGSVERLSEHVQAILKGREVVVTASARSESNPWPYSMIPVLYRDWLRGQKGQVIRIRASLHGHDFICWGWSGPTRFVGKGISAAEAPGLIAALQSKDSQARAEAAYDLGQITRPPSETIEALEKALKDRDPYVRIHAAESLARIDREERGLVQALCEALGAGDPFVRGAAVAALIQIGERSRQAIPVLLRTLEREPEDYVRSMLAFALGQLSGATTEPSACPADVIPALAQLVREDQSKLVRWSAIVALWYFGPDAQPAIPALKAALKDEEFDVYDLAPVVLSRLGPESVPALAEALHDSERPLRDQIAWRLGEMGPPARAAIPSLIGALYEEEESFRESAACALLRIDRRHGIPAAVSVLEKLQKGEQSILPTLEEIGPDARSAVPVLLERLRNPRYEITAGWTRYRTARILGKIGDRSALPVLSEVLKVKEASARIGAAEAIWRIERRAEPVIPALVALLQDDDAVDSMRRDAAALFKEFGGDGKSAVGLLIEALPNAPKECRQYMIQALGYIGPEAKKAVPVLEKVLRGDDAAWQPDRAIWQPEAALVLWRIEPNNRAIMPALRRGLKQSDPEIRLETVRALAEMDSAIVAAEFLTPLLEAFKDRIVDDKFDRGTFGPSLLRFRIAELLGNLGSQARSGIRLLLTAERDLHLRVYLLNALCRIDPDDPIALPMLQEVFEHTSFWWSDLGPALTALGPRAKALVPQMVRSIRLQPWYYDSEERLAVLQRVDAEAAAKLRPSWKVPAPVDLSAKELEAFWSDLASAEAPRAYRAVWSMVLARTPPVGFLRERLRPVVAVDEQQIGRLIADLGSNRFEVRQQASAELEKLEQTTEPALRQVLKKQPTLDLRRRVEELLERLDPKISPERLRGQRAVETLEKMCSPESRKALQELAGGASKAQLTQAAKAALERLEKRP
jgi:HEAT repeat protein